MIGILFIALVSTSFADTLMLERDHFRAITEYKRMLFSGCPDSHQIYYNIGLCYKKIQKFEKAIMYYGRAMLTTKSDTTPTEISINLAQALIKERRIENARLILEDLDNKEAKRLYASTYIFEGEFAKGRSLLEHTGLKYKYINPYRNALFSAVLPGSGQIIAGRLKNGIISFLLNIGLGYLVYRNLSNDDYLSACFFGSWFLRFYRGNIINSYNYAKAKNLERLEELYDECE